ncbi:MAG: prolipoprotein diacylglyceryl transferase [Gammaproteobacteria bacterium]|nr:prolipoprotein diacylglyceryl transferase [Gammaproteobacteria bacterium]MCP5423731.1 prolipoprotein diacylglyceryl transferase [Gammaproteobacteria bacterium]MCP5459687.1 prolipoprotein diacylglyceryl transferase [Gammaproteobacteria bacterium]
MFVQPTIDPVALKLGPLQVRWYGLMYLVGFAVGWALGRYRAARPASGWTGQQVDDLLFYIALGIVVGGRVGYVLFYNLAAFLHNPLLLFKVWEGGMSFHGGFLGVLIAMGLFARKVDKPFFVITDFIAPLVPPGLLFGRLGNFINGELWGRVTDVPWAIVFHSPGAGVLPRHPSQLYEAALEGIGLFVILWLYSSRPRPTMAVSGMFLFCYGIFRFLVEFVREPDVQMGYIAAGWLTMGQLLSLPMIPIGLAFVGWAYRFSLQPKVNKP